MTPKNDKLRKPKKQKCCLCLKTFTFSKNLYRHIRECHLKQNFKNCPFCHEKYPRIKEHIMRCKKNNSLGLLKNFMNEDIDIKQNTEFKNLSENSEQNPNNHENND